MTQNSEIIPGYAIETFLQHAEWRKDTRRQYGAALYALYDYLQKYGTNPLQAKLGAWPQFLRRQGYQPRSVNLKITVVNGYLRWCGRYDLQLQCMPLQPIEAPNLTRSEYLHLLCAARREGNQQLYLIIKLFAVTGLPLQCLGQISAAMVRDGKGSLSLHGKKLPFRFPPSFQRELLAYMLSKGVKEGAVFAGPNGRIPDRTCLFRALRELCARAGVDKSKVSPRSLRNLYQTAQEKLRENLECLQQQAYDQMLETEQVTAGWEAGP